MRQEINSTHTKPQSIGSLSTRVIQVKSDRLAAILDLTALEYLRRETSIYSASHGLGLTNLYYRNQAIRNQENHIDDIPVGARLISLVVPMTASFFNDHLRQIEVNSGYQIVKAAKAPLSIAMYNHWPDYGDTPTSSAHLSLSSNGSRHTSTISFERQFVHNFWKIQAGIDRNNMRYPSIPNAASVNALDPTSSQAQYHLGLFKEFRLSNEKRIRLHSAWNVNQSAMIGAKIYLPDSAALLQAPSSQVHGLSYIQYQHRSDENPWYSQLMISMSHQFYEQNQERKFKEPLGSYRWYQLTTEHQLHTQINAYKNMNARHVHYFGSELGLAALVIQSSESQANNPDRSPMLHSRVYYKHEYRQSSDVSWMYGFSAGMEYWNDQSNTQAKHYYSPQLRGQVSWVRHSCEASNYSINLTGNWHGASHKDIYPISGQVNIIPNRDLQSEKNIEFNINGYRMISDKLEISATVYGSLAMNDIALKDLSSTTSRSIHIGQTTMPVWQYANQKEYHNLGVEGDVRWHLTPKLLWQTRISYDQNLVGADSMSLMPVLPFRIQSGLTYQHGALGADLWVNYRDQQSAGQTSSRYHQRLQNLYHSAWQIIVVGRWQVTRQIAVIARVDNLLNTHQWDYLSTVPNFGRNGTLSLRLAL